MPFKGIHEPEPEQAELLSKRGVVIERTPMIALLGKALGLSAVELADGRMIDVAALFTALPTRQTSAIAEKLGCTMENGPAGPPVKVDP